MGIDLKSLFVAHEREIGAFVRRRIGNASDAADIAQEAFLRLARLRDAKAVEDPRGFLFTIAANLTRDHLRRVIRRRPAEAGPPQEDLVCPLATPEEQLCSQQQQNVLRAAIDQLPDKTRTIFLLYHVEDCSYREIADRLGISPRTVEYHLRQAIIQCREHARQAGIF